MKVYVGGRGTGRTTRMISWLIDGEQTSEYPGWSRVMAVPTIETVKNVVRTAIIEIGDRIREESDPRRRRQLEYLAETVSMHSGSGGGIIITAGQMIGIQAGFRGIGRVKVGIDDVERLLEHVISNPRATVGAVSICGDPEVTGPGNIDV